MTDTEFKDICSEIFPIHGKDADLTLQSMKPLPDKEEHYILLTVWLVHWDKEHQEPVDITEQQVTLCRRHYLSQPERLRHSLEAWRLVVARILGQSREALLHKFKTSDKRRIFPSDMFMPDLLDLRRASSIEDFTKALHADRRLGKYLPDEEDHDIEVTQETIEALLGKIFPVKANLMSMEVKEITSIPHKPWEDLVVMMFLIMWYIDDDGLVSLYNIWEQKVVLLKRKHLHHPQRVENYLQSWKHVLCDIMGQDEEHVRDTLGIDMSGWLPSELACATVLELKNATSQKDFAKALRAKSRLGRYLAPPAPTHNHDAS